MLVPPKQRTRIAPFDLHTQEDAFTVSPEGLKGVGDPTFGSEGDTHPLSSGISTLWLWNRLRLERIGKNGYVVTWSTFDAVINVLTFPPPLTALRTFYIAVLRRNSSDWQNCSSISPFNREAQSRQEQQRPHASCQLRQPVHLAHLELEPLNELFRHPDLRPVPLAPLVLAQPFQDQPPPSLSQPPHFPRTPNLRTHRQFHGLQYLVQVQPYRDPVPRSLGPGLLQGCHPGQLLPSLSLWVHLAPDRQDLVMALGVRSASGMMGLVRNRSMAPTDIIFQMECPMAMASTQVPTYQKLL